MTRSIGQREFLTDLGQRVGGVAAHRTRAAARADAPHRRAHEPASGAGAVVRLRADEVIE